MVMTEAASHLFHVVKFCLKSRHTATTRLRTSAGRITKTLNDHSHVYSTSELAMRSTKTPTSMLSHAI